MSTPPQQQAPAAGPPRAGLKVNRTTIMWGGAGVVALIAFVASRGGKGGDGGGGSQQFAPYDSTPYDQYDVLQNQLEDLQRQLDEGKVSPTPTPATPKPTPASPKPTPLPAKPKPPVKPLPKPPSRAPGYVTIKKGDTLGAIAKRSGISMAQLKKLNPVFWTNKKYKNGNLIWAGGKVRVK